MQTNSDWKSNLDILVSRINWKGAGFARKSDNLNIPVSIEDSLIIQGPILPTFKLQVRTQKHFASWGFSSWTVSDPAASALIAELKTFETYCFEHNILRVTQ